MNYDTSFNDRFFFFKKKMVKTHKFHITHSMFIFHDSLTYMFDMSSCVSDFSMRISMRCDAMRTELAPLQSIQFSLFAFLNLKKQIKTK